MGKGIETGELNVVTGAFGFTGKYITRRLLAEGKRILTLTGHPHRENPFGDRISVAPFNFDDPDALAASLRGASVLFNSYWIRFPRGPITYELATKNSKTLIRAARDAGVRRIVHISIANPSKDSPFPYYRGKAMVEEAIIASSIPYAILRPTVIFGTEGILINNIAWLLRHFPVFAIPGSGNYRLQPVYVEDVAETAVRAADADSEASTMSTIVDAAGPEVYSYNELVYLLAVAVGSHARVVHLPPRLTLVLSGLVGLALRDVVLTRDELEGLMANLLVSNGPSAGKTRLSDWVAQHADQLGTSYESELGRHYR